MINRRLYGMFATQNSNVKQYLHCVNSHNLQCTLGDFDNSFELFEYIDKIRGFLFLQKLSGRNKLAQVSALYRPSN